MMEIIKNYLLAGDYILNCKIGIVPTDTIYGISCLANQPNLVEEIYQIKQRDYSKPFIILIGDLSQLTEFGIMHNEIFEEYWPGPVSIILEVSDSKFAYLHRNTNSIAFRLPNKPQLTEMIKRTGPIVSTSANISSQPPITNLAEAQHCFDTQIDFFLDEGELNNPPSRIIKVQSDGVVAKIS